MLHKAVQNFRKAPRTPWLRRGRLLSLALLAMTSLLLTVLMAQSDFPQPRGPKLSKIETVEQLLPYARYYIQAPADKSELNPSLGAKAGDKLLLIVDSSIDSFVVEALRRATLEIGAEFTAILLNTFAQEEDPIKMQVKDDPHDLFPDWIWKAMENSTIVALGFPVGAHSLTRETRNWFRDHKIKQNGFQYYTRHQLAMSPLSYPEELYDAINVKVWKEIYGSKQIRVTDPYGTDLTVELDDGYWDRARKDRSPNKPPPPEEPIHALTTACRKWRDPGTGCNT